MMAASGTLTSLAVLVGVGLSLVAFAAGAAEAIVLIAEDGGAEEDDEEGSVVIGVAGVAALTAAPLSLLFFLPICTEECR